MPRSLSRQQEADVALLNKLLAKEKAGTITLDDKIVVGVIARRAPLTIRDQALAIYTHLMSMEVA